MEMKKPAEKKIPYCIAQKIHKSNGNVCILYIQSCILKLNFHS